MDMAVLIGLVDVQNIDGTNHGTMSDFTTTQLRGLISFKYADLVIYFALGRLCHVSLRFG
jgi:hypothetical protein